MCYICDHEAAERAATKAAEPQPQRELALSEILRGDPCWTYRQRLGERFGPDAKIMVTVALAVEQAQDWDWYWAASRLLTESGYNTFQGKALTPRAEAHDILRPYQELHSASLGSASEEYDRTRSRVLDETGDLNKAYDAADKVYNHLTEASEAAIKAVRETTTERLNLVLAQLFAEIYISEEGTKEPNGNTRWYGNDEPVDDEDDDYDY